MEKANNSYTKRIWENDKAGNTNRDENWFNISLEERKFLLNAAEYMQATTALADRLGMLKSISELDDDELMRVYNFAVDIKYKNNDDYVLLCRGVTSANGYQKLASRTMSAEMDEDEQVDHALKGMVSEVGELHGLYQKIYQGHELDLEHAKKELGDLLWFIAEYCTAQGWELEDIMQMNIDKLKKRYPDGFKAEDSLHRKEGDI